METVTIEDKEMTVTNSDGKELKVLAKVTTTDHGVTDENGNPKISVNINVPAVTIGVTPGEIN